jgi:hypothetical protein
MLPLSYTIGIIIVYTYDLHITSCKAILFDPQMLLSLKNVISPLFNMLDKIFIALHM